MTAILVIEEKYMIAHVGDSRIYKIKNSIEQLTEDQTFVAREMKKGTMTAEQAASDPRRNMLLQCIGASRAVEPEILFGKIEPDTVYMLCSDGFRHVLTMEEMYQNLRTDSLKEIEDMTQKCRYLIELVKQRNEKDNISVAVLKSM